jgi:hypothetical protein
MRRREFLKTVAATAAAAAAGTVMPGCPAPRGIPAEKGGAAEDLLSAASERGAPGFHHHLVLPGRMTSYVLRITNTEEKPCHVSLAWSASTVDGWEIRLGSNRIEALDPGEYREVMLEVQAGPGLPKGPRSRIAPRSSLSPSTPSTPTTSSWTAAAPDQEGPATGSCPTCTAS